jgi:hypothetical protein
MAISLPYRHDQCWVVSPVMDSDFVAKRCSGKPGCACLESRESETGSGIWLNCRLISLVAAGGGGGRALDLLLSAGDERIVGESTPDGVEMLGDEMGVFMGFR